MDTIKFLGEVLVEAAPEGLFGLLWIKIDGKKPVRLAGGILKELVKTIQIHITSDLLVYLIVLILFLELEQAEECAVLSNRSWQPTYGAIGLHEHRNGQAQSISNVTMFDAGVYKS